MRLLRTLLLTVPLIACEDDAPAPAAEASDAALPDAAPYFEDHGYVLPRSHANVMRRMRFSSLVEPGVALGFDLDGRTSEPGDEQTCGHGDLRDPDGAEGIDNQLAKIWSDLAPLVGEQVDALIQGAINEGRVLVMIELAEVDDLRDDDDVTLNVFRGLLDPDVGTQGLIAPSQTFYFDYDKPLSTAAGARLADGEIVAGPVTLQIPIAILDLDIVANLYGGYLRMRVAADGTFAGYIGGALSLDEMLGALLETGAAAETRLVTPIFQRNADLVPVDGRCTQISVGIEFEGTTAYVVRDAARE